MDISSQPCRGSRQAGQTVPPPYGRRILRWGYDFLVSLALWTYFTAGFVGLFAPFYFIAAVFARDREITFQLLNHYFYKGFFILLKMLVPGVRWSLDDRLRALGGSVVVCNHRSYLDPLLLISIFRRHKTIVKYQLFRVPLFCWMLKAAGYMPSSARGTLSELMLKQTETLPGYLAAGGVLFVFPEGTRSRDGSLGTFNPGAFKLARRCRVPIQVLYIHHTEKLFRPGRFLFNTAMGQCPQVKLLAEIRPDRYVNSPLSDLVGKVRELMLSECACHQPDD